MSSLASDRVPRVLLSTHALRELAPAIAAEAVAVELVALEDIADDDSLGVHAAFISRDITGLSTKDKPMPEQQACYRVLRRSSELAWVHTHSAGADRPIFAELMARGVAVSTSSGANAASVAHAALTGVLALARRLPQLMTAQQQRQWTPVVAGPLPSYLPGQTVVLLGWGPIARTLRPLLTLLGMQVLVVRRGSESAAPGIETLPFTELQRALPRAQWLVLACPLNADTRGLVDARALALLPRGARLVNVARGEIVVEAALVDALQREHLAGAFLDVFEHEPLPAASPLWTPPGVIITPHCAGQAQGGAARSGAIFVHNLGRWRRGETLVNLVA